MHSKNWKHFITALHLHVALKEKKHQICHANIDNNQILPDKYSYKLGLLDYDKNHNHDYFGQYCNHDYLTQLLAGRITQFFFMQI